MPQGKQPLPALVNEVKFHSQADTEGGMEEGDRIIKLVDQKDSIDVTFERRGKQFSLSLDTYPEWGKGWKNPRPDVASPVAKASYSQKQTDLPQENVAVASEPMLAVVSQPVQQSNESSIGRPDPNAERPCTCQLLIRKKFSPNTKLW